MDRVKGKVAIITGATSGMGRAAAELFAEEGATVVAVGTNEDRLQGLRDLNNPAIIPIKADVSKEAEWEKIVNFALEKAGKIDVLINNAGIQSGKLGILEMTEEVWDKTLGIDLKGVWLGMRAVIPHMMENGGSIVNCSSVAGMFGGLCDGGNVAYSAAKGGVRSMTKHAANNFGRNNIRVNSVHPGITRTGASSGSWKKEEIEAYVQMLQREVPLAMTTALPIDVAYMYLYLASDESRYVTGAEFVIDGGMTSH